MESFGARLKREREKKGITLDDISLSTKIGTRLLRALEDEHFDQLPGGIFNKGFVRAYARHLGMDEDQAIADYLEASGQTPPPGNIETPAAPILESRSEEQSNPLAQIPWGVLAIALSLVALGFAVWGFNSREKERESREARVPVAATRARENSIPMPSAAPAENPAPESNTQSPTPPVVIPTAAQNTSMPSAAPIGEFVVLIKAHDDSWISITADGKPVMEETLTASTEKAIHAKDSVSVHAGNVGALDLYFNGNKLPSQGDEGEVKTLTFDARGLQPPKPAAPATGDATNH